MTDTLVRPALTSEVRYIQWGAVIAGAVSAAALATVLHAFAAAIGLAVSSAAPTWRDASVGLWILSGVYLILVALASYGLGGYIAGPLRRLTPSRSMQPSHTHSTIGIVGNHDYVTSNLDGAEQG